MSEELENSTDGVSRRSMLKKSALVGGTMVWAAPVVQSITSPAFAQGTPEDGDTQDISFVAILLDCSGDLYRVKFNNETEGLVTECGRDFSVAQCNETLMEGSTDVEDSCPSGVSAVMDGRNLVVSLGTCTIVDYVVKCGAGAYQEPGSNDQVGCQDYPEEVNAPQAGDDGTVTFFPCSTTGTTTGS